MSLKDDVKTMMDNRGVDVQSEDGEVVTFIGRGNKRVAKYDFSPGNRVSVDDVVREISSRMGTAKRD